MTDRYQVIRDALPILIAEAQAKGGRNERAALIVELLEERDALQAENERLRKDAERYRWLRDPCSGAERVVLYSRGDFGRGLMSHTMLDAAIDAALAGKGATK